MNKILVNVYVPLLGVSYDMMIPVGLQIFEVTELIVRAVAELSEGRFAPNSQSTLSYRADGRVLERNKSALELGLCNSEHLMLI